MTTNIPCALCGASDPEELRDFKVQQSQRISHKQEKVTTYTYNDIPVCILCADKIDFREKLELIAAVAAGVFFALGLLFSAVESLNDLRIWLVPLILIAGVLYWIVKFIGDGHKIKVDAWIAKYGRGYF